MSGVFCVRCGEDIEENFVYGICPKFCCGQCCAQFSSHCGAYRGVSRNAAKKRYGCSEGDLNFLNHTVVLDSVNRNGYVHLYLEAEVAYLGRLRDSYPMKHATEMIALDDASRLERKKANFAKALPRPWPEGASLYWEWIVSDYFTYPRKWIGQLDDVLCRYECIGRAESVVHECKVDFETALEFCAEYVGGPEEFDALREKRRVVFDLFGHKILQHLTNNDRQRLVGTPLEFALADFNRRNAKIEEPVCSNEDPYSDCLPDNDAISQTSLFERSFLRFCCPLMY